MALLQCVRQPLQILRDALSANVQGRLHTQAVTGAAVLCCVACWWGLAAVVSAVAVLVGCFQLVKASVPVPANSTSAGAGAAQHKRQTTAAADIEPSGTDGSANANTCTNVNDETHHISTSHSSWDPAFRKSQIAPVALNTHSEHGQIAAAASGSKLQSSFENIPLVAETQGGQILPAVAGQGDASPSAASDNANSNGQAIRAGSEQHCFDIGDKPLPRPETGSSVETCTNEDVKEGSLVDPRLHSLEQISSHEAESNTGGCPAQVPLPKVCDERVTRNSNNAAPYPVHGARRRRRRRRVLRPKTQGMQLSNTCAFSGLQPEDSVETEHAAASSRAQSSTPASCTAKKELPVPSVMAGSSRSAAVARTASKRPPVNYAPDLSVRNVIGQPSRLYTNWKPQPFKSECFEGQVLLLVKNVSAEGPGNDPTYTHMWEGRKRMFWVQVQGRFTVQPKGTLFLGGELDGELELGLVTRSMAGMLLKVIKALSSGLHHSFGKSHDEKAHIVFPVLKMADRWVTTPAGGTPPPLGEGPLPEDMEHRKLRRSGKIHVPFDTTSTISFSFHSPYVDFASWKVANLVGLSGVCLHKFWHDSPLRFVLYEVLSNSQSQAIAKRPTDSLTKRERKQLKHPKHHSRGQHQYYFCFRLKHYRGEPHSSDEECGENGEEFGAARQVEPLPAAQSGAKPIVVGPIEDTPPPMTKLKEANADDGEGEEADDRWTWESYSETDSDSIDGDGSVHTDQDHPHKTSMFIPKIELTESTAVADNEGCLLGGDNDREGVEMDNTAALRGEEAPRQIPVLDSRVRNMRRTASASSVGSLDLALQNSWSTDTTPRSRSRSIRRGLEPLRVDLDDTSASLSNAAVVNDQRRDVSGSDCLSSGAVCTQQQGPQAKWHVLRLVQSERPAVQAALADIVTTRIRVRAWAESYSPVKKRRQPLFVTSFMKCVLPCVVAAGPSTSITADELEWTAYATRLLPWESFAPFISQLAEGGFQWNVHNLGFRKPEALRRYHYGGASQVETLRCRLDHMFASVAATLHTQATARRGWSDAGKKLLDSLREFVCSTAEAAPPPDALFFSDVVAFSVDDVARSSCSMFCGIRQASDLGIVPVGLLPLRKSTPGGGSATISNSDSHRSRTVILHEQPMLQLIADTHWRAVWVVVLGRTRAMRHSEVAEPKDSTSASPFELQVLRPDSRSPSLVMSLYDVSSCATCIGAEAMLQVCPWLTGLHMVEIQSSLQVLHLASTSFGEEGARRIAGLVRLGQRVRWLSLEEPSSNDSNPPAGEAADTDSSKVDGAPPSTHERRSQSLASNAKPLAQATRSLGPVDTTGHADAVEEQPRKTYFICTAQPHAALADTSSGGDMRLRSSTDASGSETEDPFSGLPTILPSPAASLEGGLRSGTVTRPRSRVSLVRRAFRFGTHSKSIVVLNNRQLILGSTFWRAEARWDDIVQLDAVQLCQLSAHILETVLALTTQSSSTAGVPELVVRSFENSVAVFKAVNLSCLDSSRASKCFFLNLYHIIIAHAWLVFVPRDTVDTAYRVLSPSENAEFRCALDSVSGQVAVPSFPTKQRAWVAFLRQTGYVLGGNFYSLLEIEHCILRRNLHRPDSVAALAFLPRVPPRNVLPSQHNETPEDTIFEADDTLVVQQSPTAVGQADSSSNGVDSTNAPQCKPSNLTARALSKKILQQQHKWLLNQTLRHFPELDLHNTLKFDGFAGVEPDPMITLCLNTGSQSCLPFVPVLTLQSCDEQLAYCASKFLQHKVTFSPLRGEVLLPQCFQWYRHDFGDGTVVSLLRFAIRCMRAGRKRARLVHAVELLDLHAAAASTSSGAAKASVKWHKYSWDMLPALLELSIPQDVGVEAGSHKK